MKTKINFLLENGLTKTTVSKLSESNINLLYEKFKKSKKEETSENWTETNQKTYTATLDKAQNLPVPPGAKQISVSGNTVQVKETEMTEDVALDKLSKVNPNETGSNLPIGQNNPQDDNSPDVSGDNDGMPTEGELKERFESKAQQGLFWARCNKCKSKNCKWCKMAKEFSDSTSKKHPKKSVNKNTNEDLQKYIEDTIVEMLESQVNARMTKKDLIESIKKTKQKEESFIIRKPKKVTMFSDEAPIELPIGKLFSIGKSKK